MDIAGTVRRLRREKDMTQESLASVLGVTYQTVSKWERGESFPDISLLPLIAAVFGTTTDVLLGTDEERQRLRNYELSQKLDEYRNAHDHEGAIVFMREYISENPGDYGGIKVLAYELNAYSDTLTDISCAEELRREAVSLYEHILDFNLPEPTFANEKNAIKIYLAELLWKLGEDERALKYAEEFGFPLMPFDLGAAQMKYARGIFRKTYAACRVIDAFHMLLDAVDCMVDFDDEYEVGFTDAEKLERLLLAFKILPVIFDDNNCQEESERVAQLCAQIAELYVKSGDFDAAVHNLELASEYAEKYDSLELLDIRSAFEKSGTYYNGIHHLLRYTATLLNGLVTNGGKGRIYKEPTASGELLKAHLSPPAFDALREDERFIAVSQRLRERAAKQPTYE